MIMEFCPLCNSLMGLRERDEEPMGGICPECELVDDLCPPVVAWLPSYDDETGESRENEYRVVRGFYS